MRWIQFTAVAAILATGACSSDNGDGDADPKGPLGEPNASPCDAPNPKYVAFRMDDVQAWFCASPQEQPMPDGSTVNESVVQWMTNALVDRGLNLTIGVIGTGLDQDPHIDSYLVDMTTEPLVEIASHSYSHGQNLFLTISLTNAIADLSQAQTMIEKVTGAGSTSVTPTGFIVPNYVFNEATEQSMPTPTVQLNTISGRCAWTGDGTLAQCGEPAVDCCSLNDDVVAPIERDASGNTHLPAGAVLGCKPDYFDDWKGTRSLECAQGWVDNQIENQGFSVFVLHPQEFALPGCQTIDPAEMDTLLEVLDYAKDNWCTLSFTEMKAKMGQK